MDILCGLEWDLFSDDKRTGYDYWIGGVHYLHGEKTGRYYEIDFRPRICGECIDADFGGDALAAVEAYFAQVAQLAALHPDILAHVDLIKKLNGNGEFFDENSPRYQAAALSALEAAHKADCLLEINTGAVNRGYRKGLLPRPVAAVTVAQDGRQSHHHSGRPCPRRADLCLTRQHRLPGMQGLTACRY